MPMPLPSYLHGTSAADIYAAQMSAAVQEDIFQRELADVTKLDMLLWDLVEANTVAPLYNKREITQRVILDDVGGAYYFRGGEKVTASFPAVTDMARWPWANTTFGMFIPWEEMIATMNAPGEMADLAVLLAAKGRDGFRKALGYSMWINPNRLTVGSTTLDSNFALGVNGLSEMMREDPGIDGAYDDTAYATSRSGHYYVYGGLSTYQWPLWASCAHKGMRYNDGSYNSWYKGRTVPVSAMAIQNAVGEAHTFRGSKPKYAFCSLNVWEQFYQIYEKQQFMMTSATARVSYSAIIINTIAGPLELVVDTFIPSYLHSPAYIKWGPNQAQVKNPCYEYAAYKDSGSHPAAESYYAEYCYILDPSHLKRAVDGNVPGTFSGFKDQMMTGQQRGLLGVQDVRHNMFTDNPGALGSVIRFESHELS